jgi:aminomethyltransferase
MADKRTALFPVHQKLGAKLIPFGGWTMPVEYAGIAREHTAVRTAAGLFDVSHMGEFEITGPQALDLVQYVTTNNAARLADGEAQYSVLPTREGTAMDDLLVYRYSSERFRLVVNAANIDKDFEWLGSQNRFDAQISDISDETALLGLQGPRVAEILQPQTSVPLDSLRSFHFVEGAVNGIRATISRTGYTGEDGFELYFPAVHSEFLWNSLLASGQPAGLLPAGLGARNTLRLEAKLLLYGNDLDETTLLLEAGLGWVVKLDKGDFIGREGLAKQKSDGVRRKLVGFEMLGREIARDHYPVHIDGKEVSHVTSGSPSITLKKNIGLTYLPVEHAANGARLEVLVRGRACEAEVVPTPFYKRSEDA